MRKLFNLKPQKVKRQALRRNMPYPEQKLWYYLRKRFVRGYKFRRQHGIGPYIVDFYCPEKRLAIEIDGSQHIDSESDKERTVFLNAQEISVLRFWNNEVNINLEGVMLKIATTLSPSLSAKGRIRLRWRKEGRGWRRYLM